MVGRQLATLHHTSPSSVSSCVDVDDVDSDDDDNYYYIFRSSSVADWQKQKRERTIIARKQTKYSGTEYAPTVRTHPSSSKI